MLTLGTLKYGLILLFIFIATTVAQTPLLRWTVAMTILTAFEGHRLMQPTLSRMPATVSRGMGRTDSSPGDAGTAIGRGFRKPHPINRTHVPTVISRTNIYALCAAEHHSARALGLFSPFVTEATISSWRCDNEV